MNVGRWINYAKARLDASVRSGNEQLDRREADLEADRADRPWLASDGDAPTFEEAQARIRWEAEAAERAKTDKSDKSDSAAEVPASTTAARGDEHAAVGPDGVSAMSTVSSGEGGEPPASDVDPLSGATAAEQAAARIELDQRARASAERLADIRRELGVEPPADDEPDAPNPPSG